MTKNNDFLSMISQFFNNLFEEILDFFNMIIPGIKDSTFFSTASLILSGVFIFFCVGILNHFRMHVSERFISNSKELFNKPIITRAEFLKKLPNFLLTRSMKKIIEIDEKIDCFIKKFINDEIISEDNNKLINKKAGLQDVKSETNEGMKKMYIFTVNLTKIQAIILSFLKEEIMKNNINYIQNIEKDKLFNNLDKKIMRIQSDLKDISQSKKNSYKDIILEKGANASDILVKSINKEFVHDFIYKLLYDIRSEMFDIINSEIKNNNKVNSKLDLNNINQNQGQISNKKPSFN
jgi:hypothetical protein